VAFIRCCDDCLAWQVEVEGAGAACRWVGCCIRCHSQDEEETGREDVDITFGYNRSAFFWAVFIATPVWIIASRERGKQLRWLLSWFISPAG